MPAINGPSRSATLLVVAWGGAAAFAASLGFAAWSFLIRFGRTANGAAAGPALADVLLFSLFAFHHSLFARTPIKRSVERLVPAALERSIYTWAASLLFVAVCGFWQPVAGTLYRLHGMGRLAGYGVQAAGLVLTILGARPLDVLDLAGVRPVLRARGGAPPVHVPLITTGVFAIVRHPLYFGWALLVCGSPDMTATRAVFAAVSTAYVALAIPWEERGLVAAFGDEYVRYRRRVRWRMLPLVY